VKSKQSIMKGYWSSLQKY